MDQNGNTWAELATFIDGSPTAFQATDTILALLQTAGYARLDETVPWDLEPGRGYFVPRNGSSVIAFRMGRAAPADAGFLICGAHTDSPALKLKPKGATVEAGCVKVPSEVYGGPILATWLDRPLSIAGRIMVRSDAGWGVRHVDLQTPVAVIPNLAIHMNREINKGFEYNRQTHLQAVIGSSQDGAPERVLRELIAVHESIDAKDIGEADLFLYDAMPAIRFGPKGEFVNAPRIDDLAMCQAIVKALLAAETSPATAVAVFADNEEVGSRTAQGADSSFARDVLTRIAQVCGGHGEDGFRALAKSFMLSADAAQAVHPNFADKHDRSYAPMLNGGPVIKAAATCRYATTAPSAARFMDLCDHEGVPCQTLVNRSDLPPGSTIGPITTAHLGMAGTDVGIPIWAMHSVRETAGLMDQDAITRVFTAFLSAV